MPKRPRWLPDRLLPFWEAPAVDCLRSCLVVEAGGEKYAGMFGVACVIRNRVLLPWWWGDSIHSVVLFKHQISAFWTDYPKLQKKAIRALTQPAVYPDADKAARAIVEEDRPDITGGATHYANMAVCDPRWAKGMVRLCKIGNHTFFGYGN